MARCGTTNENNWIERRGTEKKCGTEKGRSVKTADVSIWEAM